MRKIVVASLVLLVVSSCLVYALGTPIDFNSIDSYGNKEYYTRVKGLGLNLEYHVVKLNQDLKVPRLGTDFKKGEYVIIRKTEENGYTVVKTANQPRTSNPLKVVQKLSGLASEIPAIPGITASVYKIEGSGELKPIVENVKPKNLALQLGLVEAKIAGSSDAPGAETKSTKKKCKV